MVGISIVLITLPFSFYLTKYVMRYAHNHGIMDVPNNRSSHVAPTPRGGGLAIVACIIGGALILAAFGLMPSALVVTLSVGGGTIAAVGWIDDRRGVSVKLRFLIHLLSSALAVLLSGQPSQFLMSASNAVSLGLVANSLISLMALVWLINLFNFMDGIDGLAASEAVYVSLVLSLWTWGLGQQTYALVYALISASSAGFLRWNWAPARIFMGDVASGFLGYCFGVLCLWCNNANVLPITFHVILLGAFVVDATFTLLIRLIMRKKWYEAHREHAYQIAAATTGSHEKITISVLCINVAITIVMLVVNSYLVSVAVCLTMLVALYVTVKSGLWSGGSTRHIPSGSRSLGQ